MSQVTDRMSYPIEPSWADDFDIAVLCLSVFSIFGDLFTSKKRSELLDGLG